MGFKSPTGTNFLSEFNRIWDRIRKIEEVQSGRVLPVGYYWKEISGDLVIVRRSDGAHIGTFS